MKRNPFADLLNLMYPAVCLVCGRLLVGEERCLCLECLHNMPKTNYHLQDDNPVEERLWGKVPIQRGSSFFFFQKGSSFQKILHCLKYKNDTEVGLVLGKFAGIDLLQSPDFATVDVIVPVPLHPKKLKKRGYNQSEWIGKGLSEAMNKPQNTESLIRVRENVSQTQKSVYERYENTEGIFELKDKNTFEGKHILLVDDVLTTGSTLEACAKALLQTKDIKISVFTLAIA
ncbi:ComF family protein [Paludibacter sp. 221]|uniref:ComF family protein n=1 Tax=Paludibacter sp. 221 TaxID=2302939 RepID=UPI0013D1B574|nr:ComF family protein [Paludibacter sp. 221]NDV47168.1 ComF family protein [Paludibacter sp. 221]